MGVHASLEGLDVVPMWKTRRLRPRPAGSPEAPFRDRSCLSAAPSFGQPRPISRLGRAGRPYRPCFSHSVVPPLQHADDGQLAATDGGHLGLGFRVGVGVGATPKRLRLSRTDDDGHPSLVSPDSR
eukprot:scaffold35536_cov47-Phaeocystis_antarctica.AAC.3